MVQNANAFYIWTCIWTCKCAWRPNCVPSFNNFSASELQKMVRDRQIFNMLTCNCASRYSGVPFFDIPTSKSGPSMRCFTFWLTSVLLATAACNFSTSQLHKMVRTCCVLHILIGNVLLAAAACNFSTSQLQKMVRACCVYYILT